MSTIAIPSGLLVSQFSMTLAPVQRSHASPYGGSEQVIDLLNDRWMASVELAPMTAADGGLIEGFIASLRGMTNTVNLWHIARPVPAGTMRGSPTINGAHAINAGTLSIANAGAGATLKMGDLIGALGLLLMVSADCTADGAGVISVPIANRMRKALVGGEAVTWNQPTAAFRCVTKDAASAYAGGIANAVQLDFVEAIL